VEEGMSNLCDFIAFWRLWRELGKAVFAIWSHMQSHPQDSHRKGKQWESDFFGMCRMRGLHVHPPSGREDAKVNGLKVQCKAIDRVHNGWIDIANMRPVKANGGTRGYLRSEVDVIALRHHGGVFLIPADWLLCDDGTIRGRVKFEDVRQFEDNWPAFGRDYVPPSTTRQLSLLQQAVAESKGGQDGR
jgi:hypothetical protein